MRGIAWETYEADLITSLEGRMKQIMVTTRWHEDDIPGKILPENFDGRTGWYQDRTTNEWWYVLSLPAECEFEGDPLGRQVGEFMWPELFAEKFARSKKRGGYIWSALYQQRPTPEEGLWFKNEFINYYDPGSINIGDLSIYMTSDYAVTDEKKHNGDSDYTVHTVWGIDNEWNIYMLDMWRGRTLSNKWVEEFIRLAKHHKPLIAGEEQGQIIKGVGPFLHRELMNQRVFVRRKQYVSAVGKLQRAQSLIGMAAEGKLWLPTGHLYTDLFRAELLAFPGGKHDDMVDTGSLMANMLRDVISGETPDPEKRETLTLMELFAENERDD
jgi:predicted phage terminase large subunit-like protein